jgi:hypothetical protein
MDQTCSVQLSALPTALQENRDGDWPTRRPTHLKMNCLFGRRVIISKSNPISQCMRQINSLEDITIDTMI